MMKRLTFLGAAGTVTGSKYMVEQGDRRVLVDCGMYQGIKNLRERNWKPFPVDPKSIHSILLTHAHIDHSGYIPALVKNGFSGRIYCTSATFALSKVLLPDAGFLQEEDARLANLRKFSKHDPALPLYTEEDAQRSLRLFEPVDFAESIRLIKDLNVKFRPTGHILGASSIELDDGHQKVVFSGDVGRSNDLVMYPPESLTEADYLVVESTYGNRQHVSIDPHDFLKDVINKTVKRGGIVLLPAFAVGRAQSLLYVIHQLKEQNLIPDIPVYLNSPMAVTATEIFCRFHKEHRLSADECYKIDDGTHYVRTVEESIDLVNRKYPAIIISASGMASGGRVLHHLKALAPDHKNSIVFPGFQAPGTRGDAMVHGAEQIKIHGNYYPVRAEVYNLDSLSAHADSDELIAWLKHLKQAPKMTFITHGEPAAADALRLRIKDELGWRATVPEYQDAFDLSSF
jgi:metallo-beta-lactamase family protein